MTMVAHKVPNLSNGVNINLISTSKLDRMPSTEKIHFIIDEVMQGKILVLERGLTPREETALIEETMRRIDPDSTFIGIEMQSYGQEEAKGWSRIVNKKRSGRPRMAVVGPADKLRTIHKDNQQIQAMIVAPEGLVESEA